MSTSPALTPVQQHVALALASGASIASTARDARVTRQTVYNWLHSDLFAATVQELRTLSIDQLQRRINQLSDFALTAIEGILTDPAKPPGVQLRAALAVLNRSVKTESGWRLPMPVGSTEFQHAHDIVAQVQQEHRRRPIPAVLQACGLVPKDAGHLTQFDTLPKNSVPQPTHEPTAPDSDNALIPRSAPCPCGSGEKYKRCCGRNAPPVLGQAAAA